MTDLFQVPPAVAERFPDYRALSLVASDLVNRPSDGRSKATLREAEAHAREMFRTSPPGDHPHIAGWREAFSTYGMKPQRTMSSLRLSSPEWSRAASCRP